MGYRPRIAFTMTRGTPLMSFVSASPAERDRIALLFADIASEAGVAVMDVFNSDFETREKADSSPVSDADERAEEIILERLSREMPGVPVIAEEQAAADGLALVASGKMHVPPSKIVDYARVDVPILAFGSGPWRSDRRLPAERAETSLASLKRGDPRNYAWRAPTVAETANQLLQITDSAAARPTT